MAEYFVNYSAPPFAVSQNPPADHVVGGQDTSMFSVQSAPVGWDSPSVGGAGVQSLRSGLSTATTYCLWNAGDGATIATEGQDVEVVTRIFRGSGGATPVRVTSVVRSSADGSSGYMLGLRRGGGGDWNVEITNLNGFSLIASAQFGAIDGSFPTNTETWLRVSAKDVGGTVQLKVKFWIGDAASEPALWTLEAENSALLGVSGYVGFRDTRGEFWRDATGVGTNGDIAPKSLDGGGGQEDPETDGIAFSDGSISEGAAILFDDGFVSTGSLAVGVEWDTDSGNIDPNAITITDPESATPIIEVKPRETLGGTGPANRWVHWHFKLTNAAGKRPIFKVDASNRYGGLYAASWRPQYTVDYQQWAAAPSRTISSSIVEWQFAEAFTDNEVFVADHQVFRVQDFADLATALVADTSGLVAPSAPGGVIGTTPAETDDLSRAVGERDIYGFVLGDDSPTDDGGPKRWMVVDAGIHSGEILDGFPLRGIVDFYLNGTGANADKLRSNWKIGVYFALTPNGRYGGHWRGNFRDVKDPNRDWGDTGAFSLAESVIVRDAILSDLDGHTPEVGLSLHTTAFDAIAENIYRNTDVPDTTIQNAWLDALDTVDGVAWNRVNTSISSSVTGWHVTRGTPVCVISEFGTRTTNTVERYEQTGQRFLEATAVVDAAGLFYQPEIEVSLAAVESGEDAFAFSASVQVETRLQAAEAGADTAAMAASGLVGVQAAATEQGSDSTAMAASLVTAASLAVTEAGLDVTGLQVEAHIAATLAGAEQGADAYSGQVTTLNALSVQLQATEPGQDQFQGAAAALAQGTLLAQETGQDSYQGSVAAPVQADLSAQEVGADVYSGAASVDEEPVLDGVLAALSTTETGVDLAGFSIRSDILVKAGALEAGADALEMQAQLSVQAALNALEEGEDEYRSATDVVEVYRVKFKVNLPDAVGYTVDIPDRQRFDIRVM